MQAQPLIIKDWQQGIADSAYLGLGLMNNVDIELYPGAVKAQRRTVSIFHTALSSTFTADPSTDICTTASGTMPNTGTAVTVSSTGTLPTGLSSGTNYFVIRLSGTTCKLATTIANANAGTAIDITGAGTGTHTMNTVNPGTIRHFVRDKRAGTLFLQDSSARVWFYTGSQAFLLNGNTLSNGSGNGLGLFLNSAGDHTYLFAFRNASIDVVDVFGTSQLENPSWSNSWKSLNSGSGANNSHHAILGQDNILYFCDARYVGSIQENSGSSFDPSSAGTYTYNNQALDTPQNEILNWLEELGSNLLAAGDTFNFIYPWDRISSSYNLPLAVPEYSVKKIKNSGGLVYILAGTKGNIYTTQGTYVSLFKKVPGYVTSGTISWGGIALRAGALLAGLSGTNSGVYIFYPDGRLLMDNIPSTGAAAVTALYAENDSYFLGYAGGADTIDGTGVRYSSYQSVVHSKLYSVGNKTQKATYSTLEVQLGRPSSGSVRVSWRGDASSSFTQIAEFNGDLVSTSFEVDAGLTDLENIQVQVEIAGNIELMEVRLIP